MLSQIQNNILPINRMMQIHVTIIQ